MSVIPINAKVAPDQDRLGDFCRRWKIMELALFGSVLRDDFRPDSDVDVLVTFSTDAEWTLLDHAAMQQELSELFDRRVDLLSRRGIERSHNPLRRQAILSSAQPYYVAR